MTGHKDPNNIKIMGQDGSGFEYPIKVTDNGSGQGIINTLNISQLVKEEFDDIDITWVAGTVSGYNATKLEFNKNTVLVATIDITYDANDNPTNITVS